MEIKENVSNQYSKEVNTIERYLLRIIRRYFDLEELNNAQSINAIIMESIARYKQSIDYEMANVSTLNDEVGILTMDLYKLKGEHLFQKLSAFNKNFGVLHGDICEGNDDRLMDSRIPLDHNHKMVDIDTLITKIEGLKKTIVLYSNHLHVNIAILNKVEFHGTWESIDLNRIESFCVTANMLLNELAKKDAALSIAINDHKREVEYILEQLVQFTKRLQDVISGTNALLETELRKEIDDTIKNAFSILLQDLSNYVDKVTSNMLVNSINGSMLLAAKQSITIPELVSNLDQAYTYQQTGGIASMMANATVYDTTTATAFNKAFYGFNDSGIGLMQLQTDNIVLLNGISSLNYIHEVTLRSTDVGNGVLSVIIASNVDTIADGYLPTLSLMVTPELNTDNNLQHKLSAVFWFQNNWQEEMGYDDTFSMVGDWSANPNGIRIRIERNNDIIKVYRSEMNDPSVVSQTPCMTIDLSQSIYLSMFTVESQSGYGVFRQAGAEFINPIFSKFNEILLTSNISVESSTIALPSPFLSDTMEIKVELEYGNKRSPFPYITNDYVINAGVTDTKNVFLSFIPLKVGAVIPFDIAVKGKLMYSLYAKQNVPYLS